MTVVIEAAQGSGSLLTASLAADRGREVGAVPGPVNSPLAAGPNGILADGASLVREGSDVLEALALPGVGRGDAGDRPPGQQG